MRRNLILGTVSVLGLATAANAEVPSVVADIPPVHSLVSIVMGDLGTPGLLVQPGASPHGYSLRPSEAEALDDADAVFWVGEALEPWLEGPLDALAADAHVVELMETDGTTELKFRENATFEPHSHDHGHEHAEEDHDHEHAVAGHDHDHEHAEDHDHDHEEHDHDHDHEGHHHHGHDPHAWLDPENAKVWLGAIAAELSELDPENAATYAANAKAGQAELDGLIGEISAELAPVRGKHFIVFHDAYHYFENRFDFPASGSITLSDASAPSPARIEEIQNKVRELDVTCAFSEPQFNPKLVATVFRGTDAKAGVMDPLGADLAIGADLYPHLLRNLSSSLTDCLE
ncbi:zinc ABC transporter substrate-binding protein [Rhodovulum sulfidophilum]|uniref:zinc ABC transporter substrate-binding protein n=1 Tax=Rhodovulum sulfidophilum TaxID=35806 RepID=UPI00138A1C9D|nr:zinc ABC transporter substrate-binding protein [Rhodovulum sulfidophilum]NDK34991.1 zinc ABC transporter solute-binding protein [Rhodovulum sulfidophilum]